MSQTPLVSGIMIFLNGEKYIEEAIASVFAQTYENWELLLVDDGSTDGSTAIAQQYAAQYPDRIRYLEHEGHQNRGMSATRNLGIRHAQGEYIAFLDADDVWLPEKLTRQVAMLEAQPEVGVVFGPTQYWYSWTGQPEDAERDVLRGIGVQPDTIYKPPHLLNLALQNKANAPATCSVLIRRQVFEQVGVFEEAFRGMFEDRAFFAKVYLNIPVWVTHDYCDRYRQHPESNCALALQNGHYHPTKKSATHLAFLNWMMNYLTQQAVTDPEMWQALQKGRWPYDHPILYFLNQVKGKLRRIGRDTLPLPVQRWLGV